MDYNDTLNDLYRQVEERLNELNYNPIGFVGWRTKRIHKQREFQGAQAAKIKDFVRAQGDLLLLTQRLEHEKALEDQTFETQMEIAILARQMARAQQTLIAAATALGVDLPTYNAHMLNKLNVDVDVDRARQLMELDVEKHSRMKEIDFEHESKQTELQLKAALAYQQITIEQAKYALGEITRFVRELHDLEYSGLPIDLIQAQRPYYQIVIEGLKVRLEGLLQRDNGQDAEGSNANPFRRGLAEPDVAEG